MSEEKKLDIKNSKEITVDGEKYILQKLPVRQALELRQRWILDNGLADQILMSELVLENIVVTPKVSLDDFEDVTTLEDIVEEAIRFQYIEKGK